MRNTIWRAVLAVGLVLALAAPAWAATISSAQTGDWNVGATWVGGAVPNLTTSGAMILNAHVVTIPSGLTVTCGTANKNININAGGTLTVASGGELVIAQTSSGLVNSGILNVNDGGVLTLDGGRVCHGAVFPGVSVVAGILTMIHWSEYAVDIPGASCTISGTATTETGSVISVSAAGAGATLILSNGASMDIGSGEYEEEEYPCELTVIGTSTFSGQAGSALSLSGGVITLTNTDTFTVTSPIPGFGTVDWGSSLITGGLNLTTATHLNTTNATLVCNQVGTLDLGTDTANGLLVNIQAATTLGDSFACYGLQSTEGTPTLTGAGKTITLGAGGLVPGVMVLDARGTATFAFAYQGSAQFRWAESTKPANLEIASGATATAAAGTSYLNKLVNNGTLAMGTRALSLYLPDANDFWSGSGTYTGTSVFSGLSVSTDRTNATAINVGTAPWIVNSTVTAKALTLTGGLTCGNLQVYGPSTNGQWGGLMLNGPLSCANLVIGTTDTKSAHVAINAGGTITGTVAVAGTGNANTLALGGKVLAGGNWTGSGIALAVGSGSVVQWTAAAKTVNWASGGTVTNSGGDFFGTSAGSLVVTNLNNTSATALRVWNCATASCTGNTNVQALPGPPDEY